MGYKSLNTKRKALKREHTYAPYTHTHHAQARLHKSRYSMWAYRCMHVRACTCGCLCVAYKCV